MKTKVVSIAVAFCCLLITGIATAQNPGEEVIYFDYDEDVLTPEAQSELDDWIKTIYNENVVSITVTGHTDGDGSDTYNQGLSKRRASNVRSYLANHGIDTSKVEWRFFGEEKPVASNVLLSEKYRNRRVHITAQFATNIPESFTGKYKDIKVRPGRDTSIILDEKGTVLHIPANSFVDQNGNGVNCLVNLKYKEYRNSADMAFSQIPMNYKHDGVEYCFNSSGMFELHGSCDNQPLEIAKGKSLVFDYALARQNPDIAFYQLDKEKNNWAKIQDIEPLIEEVADNERLQLKPLFASSQKVKKRWLIHIGPIKLFRLADKVIGQGDRIVAWNPVEKLDNKQQATLLASGMNAGHTYPKIIKGLNVGSFGVYNCDQAYRITDRTNITANYVDENGNPIEKTHVLSMMDLNYNGAFSFDPSSFMCDPNGKNALALFTHDDQLYILTPEEFKKLKLSSGTISHTFTMTNMTDEIKSSKDLAKFLGM